MEQLELDGLSAVARLHAAHPHNYGQPKLFDGHSQITGPCGDTMAFWLEIRDDMVVKAAFVTDGCDASVACGSMAATMAEGKDAGQVMALGQRDILAELGGLPAGHEHCALLAANTLKAACKDYGLREGKPKTSCGTCGDKGCSASKRKEEESDEDFTDRQKLQSRLCRIRHKVLVMSGKGGVGKSTVAVNLATALALDGKNVGLLDVDIHGPSIPTMLGLEGSRVAGGEDGMVPIELGSMKVISLGFLLGSADDAVIWRGPMKMGVIQQFLRDVDWGDLDFLIIDAPPGTGDEPLSVCQSIEGLDGAVIVTTPQKVAAVDVRKSITFCRQLKVPVLGVVENMSGFVCPKCGEVTQILRSGGGERLAADMGVPFLGAIPIDPQIAEACDNGQAFIHHFANTPTAKRMQEIIKPIAALADADAEQTKTRR